MRRLACVTVWAIVTAGCTSVDTPPDTQAPMDDVVNASATAPRPDPSTAGELDSGSLPSAFLGFTPDVRPPEEGEFSPNGTWVVATPPDEASEQTWPHCDADSPPAPAHVLMGLYADPAGAVGVGQVFQFVDHSAADTWLSAYAAELAACAAQAEAAPQQVIELKLDDGVLVDRRVISGEAWGERVWIDDHLLRFVIVGVDVSLEELLEAV